MRRLKHWGWGYEDEQLTLEQTRVAASAIRERLGFGSEEPEQPVPLADVSLPPSRLNVPPSLSAICSTDDYERCLHSYGRSYADIVRAFRGRFDGDQLFGQSLCYRLACRVPPAHPAAAMPKSP